MSLHTFTVEHLVVDANALINNTSLWVRLYPQRCFLFLFLGQLFKNIF